MRNFFILVLVALAVIVGLYLLLSNTDGYVLLVIAGYSIEMPFIVAVLINIMFLLALYFAIGLLRWLGRTRKNMLGWASEKRRQRGLNRTTQGLVAFIEGRWDFARKSLEKAAPNSSTPLVNYLFAARASSAVGDAKAVDGFLKKAELSTEGADVAIGLTQAELQLQSRQYEQALATLLRVKKKAHNHTVVLSLLAKVYSELNDWQSLLKLMPTLRHNRLPENELDSLEQYASKSLLEKAAADGSESLQQCWKQLPVSACKRAVIIAYYAEQLIACDDIEKAESVLRQQLQRIYDAQLMEIYGRAIGSACQKQLAFAQKMLKLHSSDWQLLLTLARLSHKADLPEQAKEYYEQCIALDSRVEAYTELAALHASQGNFKMSSELYARGTETQLSTP